MKVKKTKIIIISTVPFWPHGGLPFSKTYFGGVEVGRRAAVRSALSCQLTFYFDLVGQEKRRTSLVRDMERGPRYSFYFRSGVALRL